jgi:hypothetical protein
MANPNPKPPPVHTRWKKGQSGNPKGGPKKLPELDKLLADVLGEEKDGITAAEAILKVIRAKASRGDLRAAEILLDRGYGKPKQQTDITTNGNAIPPCTIVVPPYDSAGD